MTLDRLLLQREREFSFGDDWDQAGSGLYVPSTVEPEYELTAYSTAVDLFAGAGGFSLGFHMAGFHVVGALEYDFWASITYLCNLASPDTELVFATPDDQDRWNASVKKAKRKNRNGVEAVHAAAALDRELWGSGWRQASIEEQDPSCQLDEELAEDREGWCLEPCEVFVFGDVRNVTGADFLAWLGMEQDELTAIMGGPPCQGFSISGKRDVMDPRNSLVFDFMRLVVEMRPHTFIMENVPNMVNMVTPEGLPVVDALCRIAQDGGFGNYDAIKRSLLSSSGAGAGLKGKPEHVRKSKRQPKKKVAPSDGQEAMAL